MKKAATITDFRPVHPFPARMAPSFVRGAIPERQGSPLRVLDPMSGSGTTLVCARLKGHYAIGCDTDPLARRIARAWCADVDSEELRHYAAIVLLRAQNEFAKIRAGDAYPKGADDETRRFIRYWFGVDWFGKKNRCQLAALARCISRIRSKEEIKNLLWCAFSRMIITKTRGVSLAMDVSHSRPHKFYDTAPAAPFGLFFKEAARIADNSPFNTGGRKKPQAKIKSGDAKKLPVGTGSIDMIVTSPPYLNAIDYLRGHRLALVWMGHNMHELREIRSGNIGTEAGDTRNSGGAEEKIMMSMGNMDALERRYAGMIRRYVRDMDGVMSECARVLKRDGRAIFVVGDSSIRGIFVKNSEALKSLARKNGLVLHSQESRPIEVNRRYLPPPTSPKAGKEMSARMKEEVILEYRAT